MSYNGSFQQFNGAKVAGDRETAGICSTSSFQDESEITTENGIE